MEIAGKEDEKQEKDKRKEEGGKRKKEKEIYNENRDFKIEIKEKTPKKRNRDHKKRR